MSLFEKSQRSTSGLQLPGLVHQLSPTEQLPFPESSPSFTETTPHLHSTRTPGPATPAPDVTYTPGITQPLPGEGNATGVTQQLPFNASPAVTRLLPDLQTGTLPTIRTTTSLRQPIVIRGSGKKSTGTMRPPTGRRWVISSAILGMMVVLTLLTGFVVVPLATGNHYGFSLFQGGTSLYKNSDPSNPNFVAQQAATATAIVRQDGYQPGGYTNAPTTYTGGPGVTPDRFSFGQCTYWADMEYHNKTGFWVNWIGNAYQWASGARAAGWVVSSTPKVYSIIVLQPYVEGAGYYGHVAVVEHINSDGSVVTSTMNWYAGGGGWDRVSTWIFSPGSGVLFVWHP